MGFVSSVYIMIFITTTCTQCRRQYDTDGFCVECLYNDIHNYNMYTIRRQYDTDGFCVECLYNDIHNYNMYPMQETI